jgi:Protein kinase domain
MGLDSAAWARAGEMIGPETGGDEPSVTHVGEPALIRATSLDIGRGALLAGRYQIEAAIGKGGSGIVLRAFDRVAQVPVAVKILKPELASDPRWVERFSRELRLARRIQNANVCRVFDIGQADGHWFITMELATGGSLRDQIGPAAPVRSEDARLSDVRAVVAGLAAIHEAGIVHRDLKPDNFLRMDDGRLVLSDFGLATNRSDASTVSILVGTPSYMPPEVVAGEQATFTSDVWSLGVVMHEILFARRPEWTSGTYRRVSLPSRRDLSRAERSLALLVEECIQDDAGSRPSDGRDAQRRLDAVLSSRQQHRLWPLRTARARWAWPLIAVGSAAVAALVSGHVWRGASAGLDVRATAARTAAIGGQAADWTKTMNVVASFHEPVHCMSWLDPDRVLRLVVGSPRRAVDVDVRTSVERPAPLSETTFALGCPQQNTRGEVLFQRFDASGRQEIMLAASEGDASGAKPMTIGSDPVWLPSNDEFVYTADDAHAAVFSVPVMTTNIISESSENAGMLVEKVVSQDGKSIALRYLDSTTHRHVVVHELPSLAVRNATTFSEVVSEFEFGGPEQLLFSTAGADGSSLAAFDLRSNKAERLGFIPGRSLGTPKVGRDWWAVKSYATKSDVWKVDNGARTIRLTTDGKSVFPDQSPNGDLLVEHLGSDLTFSIVLYAKGAAPRAMTMGPIDVTPRFLPDGRGWLYVDIRRRTIRRCSLSSGLCEDIYTADAIPFLPVASPDQKLIAFMTSVGRERVKVLDTTGGVRDLGAARPDCSPHWASADRLWVLRGTEQAPTWAAIDVATGEQTATLPVPANASHATRDCPYLFTPPGVVDPPQVATWTAEETDVGVVPRQQAPGIGQNP